MVTFGRSRLFLGYIILSSALMGAISILQYYKYSIFGTSLLLGWDSPRYVWLAKDVISEGPFQMIRSWNYPTLYVQLLAFLGYLAGDVIIVERVLPLIFGILLIFANAKITLKITENIHMAGLAAFFTSLSLNTLRLFADLNRNLMALSLSFLSFLLISDFASQNVINRKSLLSKTYVSMVMVFIIIAGTQFETFFVLALSSILLGISSRNWKKLMALTLTPAIPTIALLALFPQLLLTYGGQIGLLARELMLNEVLLWSGGSWILFGFLIAGVAYVSYKAIRQRDMLASMIFSWVAVITLLVILIMQGIVTLPAEYAFHALLVLPIPVLFASAVFASTNLLRDVFLEIGVYSPTKRHAIKVSLRQMTLVGTVLILVIGSTAITTQHYDEFLTPYIPKSSYDKISAAGWFLNRNGLSKPVVVFYGESASWFSSLYSSYVGAEIGEHYSYRGDIDRLLQTFAIWPQYYEQTLGYPPILLITPYLYDKEIPYYITPYHIGQGIYVIPPNSTVSFKTFYGPTVTVIGDNDITEVKSEYLYADQNDPSLVVLRVATRGYTSYIFENYPEDWSFLKLEQGGALSFPEKDPRRLDGASAIEGNDPTESTQNWSMPQAGAISINNSSKKEGYASLEVEGLIDSWGTLGARYNPAGTWNLSVRPLLAVWAKASEKTPFSITLHDSAGNTRTFWDIQEYGSSATTQWKRFAVNLSNYTSQTSDFDLAKVDFIDFYVYSSPGKQLSLSLDDLIVDDVTPLDGIVYKARVIDKDDIAVYFVVRREQISSS